VIVISMRFGVLGHHDDVALWSRQPNFIGQNLRSFPRSYTPEQTALCSTLQRRQDMSPNLRSRRMVEIEINRQQQKEIY
jgi:hypothetical protein